MKKDSKKESAVSPVIGTILLVAITVVLVAIISAVVMGMTGQVGQAHSVGIIVTAGDATGEVDVKFTGGEFDKITTLTVGGVDATTAVTAGLGVTTTVNGVASGTSEISAVATFSDGTQQIIWTGTLTVL